MSEELQLNDKARHKPSGVEGTVVARCIYRYDAPQVCIQRDGVNNDGLPWESMWFAEPNCELIER